MGIGWAFRHRGKTSVSGRDLLMQWLTRNWGMFVLLAVWYTSLTPFAIFSLPPFLPGHDIHNLTLYLGLAFIYSFVAQPSTEESWAAPFAWRNSLTSSTVS